MRVAHYCLLFFCILQSLNAQDLSQELALLGQSLAVLEKELPTPAPKPARLASPASLLEEIRKRQPLCPTAKPAQRAPDEREKQIKEMANKYRTRPAMVSKIIQDIKRSGMYKEVDFEDTGFMGELKRRLNLNLERSGSRVFDQPVLPAVEEVEEPASPKKIRTQQDQEAVNKLSQTILKELKKDFTALTPEIAYQAALDLFERNWVSLRNKIAEQEARKFIREYIEKMPAVSQHERRPSKEELEKQAEQLKQRQQEIEAIVARRGSTESTGEEEWET